MTLVKLDSYVMNYHRQLGMNTSTGVDMEEPLLAVSYTTHLLIIRKIVRESLAKVTMIP